MRSVMTFVLVSALCGCAFMRALVAGGGAAGECVPGAVMDLQAGFHNGGDQWGLAIGGILKAAVCVVQIEEAVRTEVRAHGCTSPNDCGVRLTMAGATLPALLPKIPDDERSRMVFALVSARDMRAKKAAGK